MEIIVYDRSVDGLATAVLFAENREPETLLRGQSITAVKRGLSEIKEVRGLRRVGVSHVVGTSAEQGIESQMSASDSLSTPTQKFSINEKFDMVADIIGMLVQGNIDSLLLSGKGGCGKTYTVLDILKRQGFEKLPAYTPKESGGGNCFRHFKGGCSMTELFKLLHDHNGEILIFDDFDGILIDKDPKIQGMLKAGLDTYSEREISMFSPYLQKQGYPPTFIFTGKIIFISNLPTSKIPQPILSRVLNTALDFTTEELVERMRAVSENMAPEVSEEVREVAIQWIEEHRDRIQDISLRTFLKVVSFANSGLSNWKDLCEYSN